MRLRSLLSVCLIGALSLVAGSDSENTSSQSKYRLHCEVYDWGTIPESKQDGIKAAWAQHFTSAGECWTAAKKVMQNQYRTFGRFSAFVACFEGDTLETSDHKL